MASRLNVKSSSDHENMIMVKRINFVKFFAILLLVTPIVNAKNFQFMAIGDTSYVSASQLDQLVDRINHEPTRFTIHVGDIKSGSTLCSDDMFARVDNGEQDAEGFFHEGSFVAFARTDEIEVLP